MMRSFRLSLERADAGYADDVGLLVTEFARLCIEWAEDWKLRDLVSRYARRARDMRIADHAPAAT
jgi:hypothetical protein